MKVKVVPKKPIPGILPKNKWIDVEMVLDLNKKEIAHCMQFGNVYDEYGNLIDSVRIKSMSSNNIIVKSVSRVNDVVTTSISEGEEPIIIKLEPQQIEEPVNLLSPLKVEPVTEIEVSEHIAEEELTTEIVEDSIVEEEIEEAEEDKYFYLEEVNCVRENEYILLTTKVVSNYELKGNLYGLFTIASGTRPSSIEFDNSTAWIRFSTKFANFDTIRNGAKFTFRIIVKDETEFGYRILIKEGSEELVKFEGKVNPSEV